MEPPAKAMETKAEEESAELAAWRRVLGIRSLAQDSPVVAEVVEEEQDIPLVQSEEEVKEPPLHQEFQKENNWKSNWGGFKRFRRKNQM